MSAANEKAEEKPIDDVVAEYLAEAERPCEELQFQLELERLVAHENVCNRIAESINEQRGIERDDDDEIYEYGAASYRGSFRPNDTDILWPSIVEIIDDNEIENGVSMDNVVIIES